MSSDPERNLVREVIRSIPAIGCGHVGVAPAELEHAFKRVFGTAAASTVNAMIRDGEIVLCRLIYRARDPNKSSSMHGPPLIGSEILDELPENDSNVKTHLRVYLRDNLPLKMRRAVRRREVLRTFYDGLRDNQKE